MPFRQTERLPHEQNKKTERELILKTAPRKRQQQQKQPPNYKLHFLGCAATLGSAGVPGALSLLHRERLWGRALPVCKPSGKMDLGVPRHPPGLCRCRSRGPAWSSYPFPWPRSSPAAAMLSLRSFLEVRFVMGAVGVGVFWKKVCNFNSIILIMQA